MAVFVLTLKLLFAVLKAVYSSSFLVHQYNETKGNNLFQDIEHTRYFCPV